MGAGQVVAVSAAVVVVSLGLYLLARKYVSDYRWEEEYVRAVEEARWVAEHLMPALLTAPTPEQSQQAWESGRERVEELGRRLGDLSHSAKKDGHGRQARALGSAVAHLIEVVSAEAQHLSSSERDATTTAGGARVRIEEARTALGRSLPRRA